MTLMLTSLVCRLMAFCGGLRCALQASAFHVPNRALISLPLTISSIGTVALGLMSGLIIPFSLIAAPEGIYSVIILFTDGTSWDRFLVPYKPEVPKSARVDLEKGEMVNAKEEATAIQTVGRSAQLAKNGSISALQQGTKEMDWLRGSPLVMGSGSMAASVRA